MGWRKPNIADLAATLSQAELDAFRRSSSYEGDDAVEALIARTAEMVRGFCRANRSCVMSPIAGEIPEALISASMDYAAYDVLKRLPVAVNEDRRRAREAAAKLFEAVARNDFKPEPPDGLPDEEADGSATAATPACGRATPTRLLD